MGLVSCYKQVMVSGEPVFGSGDDYIKFASFLTITREKSLKAI